ADHHVHPRRPCASRTCPKDDGGVGSHRPPDLVLREHRRRPRRCGRQCAERVQDGAGLCVSLADAGYLTVQDPRVWCGAMRLPSKLCATIAATVLLTVPGCSKVITGAAVPAPHDAAA